MAEGYPEDSRWINKICDVDSAAFLDQLVFRGYVDDVEQVSFNCFLDHARDARFAHMLSSLRNDLTVSIVQLFRRNKLTVYLSQLRVMKSNSWSSSDPSSRFVGPLAPDLMCCRRAFERLEEEQAALEALLGNRQHLRLYYEDIVRDPAHAYEQVQSYLKVRLEQIVPSTQKQRAVPISSRISNYDGLREMFCDSP